jgi:hypothetical protein
MLRKIAIATFALATFGMVGTAAAEPLELPADTPLVLDFSNIEQLYVGEDAIGDGCIDVPGTTDWGCSDNWGFIRINTINTSVVVDDNADIDDQGVLNLYNATALANGDTEIFGMFYGINLEDCSGTGEVTCTASGGYLDLYWHEDGIAGVDVISDLDPTTADVDAVTSGQLLVRLYFDWGIIDGDETTTITSDVNLLSTFGSGNGNGFLSVDTSVDGLWSDALNGDWFYVDGDDAGTVRGDSPDELRDVKFRNTFTSAQGAAADWHDPTIGAFGLTSSDPAEAFTAVPEPASLTLFGVGLAAAAVAARRRKKSA